MEHYCNVKLATDYDLDTAHFLHHLKFWTFKNLANKKHIRDGFCWTYDSLEAFCDIFPYWTKRQLERVINNCVKAGLVKRGNYNRTSYDRTTWYALSYKSYWYFPELADPKYLKLLYLSISPNGDMSDNAHFTEWGNGLPQTVTPIPDTIPDTKKKTPIVPLGSDLFKEFWDLYPVKKDRKKCLALWKRKNLDPNAPMIIEKLKIQNATDKQWIEGFIPNPSTYLNNDRWEDEITPLKPVQKLNIQESKIVTKIPEKTLYSRFLGGIATDIKLGLFDPIPELSFDEWKEHNYGEDHRAYLKRLGIQFRKIS